LKQRKVIFRQIQSYVIKLFSEVSFFKNIIIKNTSIRIPSVFIHALGSSRSTFCCAFSYNGR